MTHLYQPEEEKQPLSHPHLTPEIPSLTPYHNTEEDRKEGNENAPSQPAESSMEPGSMRQKEFKKEEEPKSSNFYVSITGQIEYGEFTYLDGLCCKYNFAAGPDWNVVDGIDSGISQHSFKADSATYSKRIVWNFPIEILYRSVNPHGWPQIVVVCSGHDYLGRENNQGYGVIHIPTTIGKHERYIKMFAPICSSWITRMAALITGTHAEYIDAPKTLADGEGREVTRVKAEGVVKVVFHVRLKGFEKFGYNN